MKLYISNTSTWCPYITEINRLPINEISEQHMSEFDFSWPKLDFVPAMQRRRLSPFAKIALYIANKTLEHDVDKKNDIPIIFSSRHGDIHKTSILLEDLAHQEMLSPTAFALSVHNAVPSLYSILTGNKAAINAIAAGKDSFFMALVDAYVRLSTGVCDEVLLIHADQNIPEVYGSFQDELQISHAIAMKISTKETPNSHVIKCSFTHNKGTTTKSRNDSLALPAAISFFQWLDSQEIELNYYSNNYHWRCKKYE